MGKRRSRRRYFWHVKREKFCVMWYRHRRNSPTWHKLSQYQINVQKLCWAKFWPQAMRKHKKRPQKTRVWTCGNQRVRARKWALACPLWIAAKLNSSRRRTHQLLIQTCHAVRIRCFRKQLRPLRRLQPDRSRFQRNLRNFPEKLRRQQRPLHRFYWINHLQCTSKNRLPHWNYETHLPVSARAQITVAKVVVAVVALSSLNRPYSGQHVVPVSAKMDANWKRKNRWKRTPHSNGKSQEYSKYFLLGVRIWSTSYLINNDYWQQQNGIRLCYNFLLWLYWMMYYHLVLQIISFEFNMWFSLHHFG